VNVPASSDTLRVTLMINQNDQSNFFLKLRRRDGVQGFKRGSVYGFTRGHFASIAPVIAGLNHQGLKKKKKKMPKCQKA